MNCKPGDLAVIVRSIAGNEGRIVRCLEFVGPGDDQKLCDCWLLDQQIPGTLRPIRVISDSKLRPIRDNNGEDETLTWAGKPEGVKA